MSHTTKCGSNRAGERLTIGCVGHLFAFDAVFLGGEGKGDICRGEELRKSRLDDIKIVHGANFELDVFETEGMLRVSGGVGIFARS